MTLELITFACGVVTPLFVLALRKELRSRATSKCSWCAHKLPRGAKGVCDACLKESLNDRAAPADWPEA